MCRLISSLSTLLILCHLVMPICATNSSISIQASPIVYYEITALSILSGDILSIRLSDFIFVHRQIVTDDYPIASLIINASTIHIPAFNIWNNFICTSNSFTHPVNKFQYCSEQKLFNGLDLNSFFIQKFDLTVSEITVENEVLKIYRADNEESYGFVNIGQSATQNPDANHFSIWFRNKPGNSLVGCPLEVHNGDFVDYEICLTGSESAINFIYTGLAPDHHHVTVSYPTEGEFRVNDWNFVSVSVRMNSISFLLNGKLLVPSQFSWRDGQGNVNTTEIPVHLYSSSFNSVTSVYILGRVSGFIGEVTGVIVDQFYISPGEAHCMFSCVEGFYMNETIVNDLVQSELEIEFGRESIGVTGTISLTQVDYILENLYHYTPTLSSNTYRLVTVNASDANSVAISTTRISYNCSNTACFNNSYCFISNMTEVLCNCLPGFFDISDNGNNSVCKHPMDCSYLNGGCSPLEKCMQIVENIRECVDACIYSLCLNNGVCTPLTLTEYNCTCDTGFYGSFCECRNSCLVENCTALPDCITLTTTSPIPTMPTSSIPTTIFLSQISSSTMSIGIFSSSQSIVMSSTPIGTTSLVTSISDSFMTRTTTEFSSIIPPTPSATPPIVSTVPPIRANSSISIQASPIVYYEITALSILSGDILSIRLSDFIFVQRQIVTDDYPITSLIINSSTIHIPAFNIWNNFICTSNSFTHPVNKFQYCSEQKLFNGLDLNSFFIQKFDLTVSEITVENEVLKIYRADNEESYGFLNIGQSATQNPEANHFSVWFRNKPGNSLVGCPLEVHNGDFVDYEICLTGSESAINFTYTGLAPDHHHVTVSYPTEGEFRVNDWNFVSVSVRVNSISFLLNGKLLAPSQFSWRDGQENINTTEIPVHLYSSSSNSVTSVYILGRVSGFIGEVTGVIVDQFYISPGEVHCMFSCVEGFYMNETILNDLVQSGLEIEFVRESIGVTGKISLTQVNYILENLYHYTPTLSSNTYRIVTVNASDTNSVAISNTRFSHNCSSNLCFNNSYCFISNMTEVLCNCLPGFFDISDNGNNSVCKHPMDCSYLNGGCSPLETCMQVSENIRECVDACRYSPCLNNGVCTPLTLTEYNCTCDTGFYGSVCECKNSCLVENCTTLPDCITLTTTTPTMSTSSIPTTIPSSPTSSGTMSAEISSSSPSIVMSSTPIGTTSLVTSISDSFMTRTTTEFSSIIPPTPSATPPIVSTVPPIRANSSISIQASPIVYYEITALSILSGDILSIRLSDFIFVHRQIVTDDYPITSLIINASTIHIPAFNIWTNFICTSNSFTHPVNKFQYCSEQKLFNGIDLNSFFIRKFDLTVSEITVENEVLKIYRADNEESYGFVNIGQSATQNPEANHFSVWFRNKPGNSLVGCPLEVHNGDFVDYEICLTGSESAINFIYTGLAPDHHHVTVSYPTEGEFRVNDWNFVSVSVRMNSISFLLNGKVLVPSQFSWRDSQGNVNTTEIPVHLYSSSSNSVTSVYILGRVSGFIGEVTGVIVDQFYISPGEAHCMFSCVEGFYMNETILNGLVQSGLEIEFGRESIEVTGTISLIQVNYILENLYHYTPTLSSNTYRIVTVNASDANFVAISNTRISHNCSSNLCFNNSYCFISNMTEVLCNCLPGFFDISDNGNNSVCKHPMDCSYLNGGCSPLETCMQVSENIRECVDACRYSPCLNNGVCTLVTLTEYNCTCDTGFYGSFCECQNSCLAENCTALPDCITLTTTPTLSASSIPTTVFSTQTPSSTMSIGISSSFQSILMSSTPIGTTSLVTSISDSFMTRTTTEFSSIIPPTPSATPLIVSTVPPIRANSSISIQASPIVYYEITALSILSGDILSIRLSDFIFVHRQIVTDDYPIASLIINASTIHIPAFNIWNNFICTSNSFTHPVNKFQYCSEQKFFNGIDLNSFFIRKFDLTVSEITVENEVLKIYRADNEESYGFVNIGQSATQNPEANHFSIWFRNKPGNSLVGCPLEVHNGDFVDYEICLTGSESAINFIYTGLAPDHHHVTVSYPTEGEFRVNDWNFVSVSVRMNSISFLLNGKLLAPSQFSWRDGQGNINTTEIPVHLYSSSSNSVTSVYILGRVSGFIGEVTGVIVDQFYISPGEAHCMFSCVEGFYMNETILNDLVQSGLEIEFVRESIGVTGKISLTQVNYILENLYHYTPTLSSNTYRIVTVNASDANSVAISTTRISYNCSNTTCFNNSYCFISNMTGVLCDCFPGFFDISDNGSDSVCRHPMDCSYLNGGCSPLEKCMQIVENIRECVDACIYSLCLNNGVCTPLTLTEYNCTCDTGFYGSFCECRNSCLVENCTTLPDCIALTTTTPTMSTSSIPTTVPSQISSSSMSAEISSSSQSIMISSTPIGTSSLGTSLSAPFMASTTGVIVNHTATSQISIPIVSSDMASSILSYSSSMFPSQTTTNIFPPSSTSVISPAPTSLPVSLITRPTVNHTTASQTSIPILSSNMISIFPNSSSMSLTQTTTNILPPPVTSVISSSLLTSSLPMLNPTSSFLLPLPSSISILPSSSFIQSPISTSQIVPAFTSTIVDPPVSITETSIPIPAIDMTSSFVMTSSSTVEIMISSTLDSLSSSDVLTSSTPLTSSFTSTPPLQPSTTSQVAQVTTSQVEQVTTSQVEQVATSSMAIVDMSSSVLDETTSSTEPIQSTATTLFITESSVASAVPSSSISDLLLPSPATSTFSTPFQSTPVTTVVTPISTNTMPPSSPPTTPGPTIIVIKIPSNALGINVGISLGIFLGVVGLLLATCLVIALIVFRMSRTNPRFKRTN